MYYLIQDDNIISGFKEVYLMRDEDPGAPAQVPVDAALEQQPAHVGIHRRERVVQQVNVSLYRIEKAIIMTKQKHRHIYMRHLYLGTFIFIPSYVIAMWYAINKFKFKLKRRSEFVIKIKAVSGNCLWKLF